MTTNRASTPASKRRNKKHPRNYKKEQAAQPSNASAKRQAANEGRDKLGLKKGSKQEASHSKFGAKGSVRSESGKTNSKRQPKRRKT